MTTAHKQPEALRLAEIMEKWSRRVGCGHAAAELCATGPDTHLCPTHADQGAPVQASMF